MLLTMHCLSLEQNKAIVYSKLTFIQIILDQFLEHLISLKGLHPVVNFINILRAAFALIFLHQKVTKPNNN
jgi:hypothetical protein